MCDSLCVEYIDSLFHFVFGSKGDFFLFIYFNLIFNFIAWVGMRNTPAPAKKDENKIIIEFFFGLNMHNPSIDMQIFLSYKMKRHEYTMEKQQDE